MLDYRERPPRGENAPAISVILLDWKVRESFHSLTYLNKQTLPRDRFGCVVLAREDEQNRGRERRMGRAGRLEAEAEIGPGGRARGGARHDPAVDVLHAGPVALHVVVMRRSPRGSSSAGRHAALATARRSSRKSSQVANVYVAWSAARSCSSCSSESSTTTSV